MPENTETARCTERQSAIVAASKQILEAAAGRELTSEEKADLAEQRREFDALNDKIRAADDIAAMSEDPTAGRRTSPPSLNGHAPAPDTEAEKFFARPIGGSPSYARLFGAAAASGNDGWRDAGEFLRTVALGRSDQRLKASADSESGSPGGFSVPGVLASAIFDASLRQELVRPRAKVYNLTSSNISVVGLDTEDQSTRGSVGGLAMQMLSELATANDQTPKFRAVNFVAKKGMLYCGASIELVEDSINFTEELTNGFASAMALGLDNQFYRGTGAGQCVGILNSPATISVAKEGSQAADTISFNNVLGMYSRLYPPSIPTSTWWAHPSCVPELFKLSVRFFDAAGSDYVGGSLAPVFNQTSDGRFTLLGRPLEVTAHANKLGDQGDIALCNWGAYGIALRRLVSIESNRAAGWSNYSEHFRAIVRFDGMPLRSKPITLPDSADSLSDFVVLDSR